MNERKRKLKRCYKKAATIGRKRSKIDAYTPYYELYDDMRKDIRENYAKDGQRYKEIYIMDGRWKKMFKEGVCIEPYVGVWSRYSDWCWDYKNKRKHCNDFIKFLRKLEEEGIITVDADNTINNR